MPPLSLNKAASADSVRTRELGAIHAARRALALQEDSYRAIISRFSKRRTESSKDLTQDERRQVIEYFRSIGFKPRKKPAKMGRVPLKGADQRPQAMKLKALWIALYNLGAVRDRSDDALAAFVCRHTGIEVIRWNRSTDLDTAIECLKGWCVRVGYRPKAFDDGLPCPMRGRFEPSLITAQWTRLAMLGDPAPSLIIWLRGIGIDVPRISMLTIEQAAIAIDRLGEFIRRHPENSE